MLNPLPLLFAALVISARRPKTASTTWFIDGNNLLGHRGTPRDADTLTTKLQPIRGAAAVILVLDGRPEITETQVVRGGDNNTFQRVNLPAGQSADEYILDEIRARNQPNAKMETRVQVVTADRQLRRQVLGIKPIVKDVVNPVTFWRRYLPRLCGYKRRSSKQPHDVGQPQGEPQQSAVIAAAVEGGAE